MYHVTVNNDASSAPPKRTKKNPHAVALGKLGGQKGGPARARKLGTKAKSAIGKKAAAARWNVPLAIAEGELAIADPPLPCYVLDDERRVLSTKGMVTALEMSFGGVPSGEGRLVRFVSGNRVSPYISPEVAAKITDPIRFRMLRGGSAYGYEASVLADLCTAVLKAADDGALQPQQLHIARQCEILLRGFAKVGIVALVDEATGYQYTRARWALADILEQFIAKELAAWAKVFPNDFYRHMFRLRGLEDVEDIGKRPAYFGHLTNDVVYARLAPAVLEELQRKNPRTGTGRRARHHQWLTRDVGNPRLMAHLDVVVAVMKLSADWSTFVANLDRVAPRFGDTIPIPFPEA